MRQHETKWTAWYPKQRVAKHFSSREECAAFCFEYPMYVMVAPLYGEVSDG